MKHVFAGAIAFAVMCIIGAVIASAYGIQWGTDRAGSACGLTAVFAVGAFAITWIASSTFND